MQSFKLFVFDRLKEHVKLDVDIKKNSFHSELKKIKTHKQTWKSFMRTFPAVLRKEELEILFLAHTWTDSYFFHRQMLVVLAELEEKWGLKYKNYKGIQNPDYWEKLERRLHKDPKNGWAWNMFGKKMSWDDIILKTPKVSTIPNSALNHNLFT